jgi:hypothetical protein
MVRRSRSIIGAGSISLSALPLLLLFLAAGRDACAQQVGTLTNTRGLDFGRFVAGTGGTVVISPAGVRSRTGGVILLNSPSAAAATFSVGVTGTAKGAKLKNVILTLPANGTVRLTSGSNSMAVDTFVSTPAAGLSSSLSTTPTASVGATMTVAPNQPSGTYSGSFTVIANFQ